MEGFDWLIDSVCDEWNIVAVVCETVLASLLNQVSPIHPFINPTKTLFNELWFL